MLTREMILSLMDFEKEEVHVPEWNGSVYIRTMSALARDWMQVWFMKYSLQDDGQRDAAALIGMQAAMVSYCLCNEDGELLFDDDEGRAILSRKNGQVISRLYDIASRVNKMDDDEVQGEKKDLQRAPINGSSTPSV